MENTTAAFTDNVSVSVTDFVSNQQHLTDSGKLVITFFGVLMSAVSLYTSIALITHRLSSIKAKKELKKSKRPRKMSSINWMDNLSVLASVIILMSLINDHVLFYSQDLSTFSCKLMQFMSKLFYSSGHCCVYLFFWFRQRSCYRNPSLAKIHNKCCRFISAAILPFFLLMNIAGIVSTGLLWSFNRTSRRCIETNQSPAPLIALFVASAAMQITLLSLFLYPLKSHANFLHEREMLSPADKLLAQLIKRSIISTLLCVLADASAFIAAITIDPNLPFIVKNYIYDGNLICNVICMVGSFADWKSRVAPWCTERYVTKFERTGSYASTNAYTTSLRTTQHTNSNTKV